MFDDIKRRLSSRKFLLALGAAITLIANGQWPEAASVVVAYLAGESFVDARAAGSKE